MEKKKIKTNVLLFMIIGLIAMGILNGLMYKFNLSELSVIIIDIIYAVVLGLSLRILNRKS